MSFSTGTDWAVLYPTRGLFYGRVIFEDWAIAYARAYNNWLHDAFLKDNPRLRRTGIPSYAALKTFVPDRPGHDRRYAIDATKLRTELGWRPSYDFERGLRHTVEWYVSHREWCATVLAGKDQDQRLGLGPTR